MVRLSVQRSSHIKTYFVVFKFTNGLEGRNTFLPTTTTKEKREPYVTPNSISPLRSLYNTLQFANSFKKVIPSFFSSVKHSLTPSQQQNLVQEASKQLKHSKATQRSQSNSNKPTSSIIPYHRSLQLLARTSSPGSTAVKTSHNLDPQSPPFRPLQSMDQRPTLKRARPESEKDGKYLIDEFDKENHRDSYPDHSDKRIHKKAKTNTCNKHRLGKKEPNYEEWDEASQQRMLDWGWKKMIPGVEEITRREVAESFEVSGSIIGPFWTWDAFVVHLIRLEDGFWLINFDVDEIEFVAGSLHVALECLALYEPEKYL